MADVHARTGKACGGSDLSGILGGFARARVPENGTHSKQPQENEPVRRSVSSVKNVAIARR